MGKLTLTMNEATAPFLTPAEFRTWLRDRLTHGYTRAALGKSLGVTGMAITRWLTGSGVSNTVLLLAERIMGEKAGQWPL